MTPIEEFLIARNRLREMQRVLAVFRERKRCAKARLRDAETAIGAALDNLWNAQQKLRVAFSEDIAMASGARSWQLFLNR